MKSRNFTRCLWLGCLALAKVGMLTAQTNIPMPLNSGPVTFTLSPPANCSYTFSDDGGPGSPYGTSAGSGSVVTFQPSTPGNKVVVQFLSFQTEEGFDALFVYDGTSTAAPQISSGATALLGFPNPFSGGMGGWQGTSAPYNAAPNTVRATASNASGALTFAFDADLTIGKSGWTAIVSEVPGNACSLQAPGALNVTAPAGACEAIVQTVPPAIVPGACSLALELRYRLNDGPVVTVPNPAPPFITLTGVPVGLNVISWQLVEPCGGGLSASAAQLVTVKDQTPPTVTLPPNVTLNLGPGDCSAPYTYAVSAYDNCTFAQTLRVDHPLDFNNGAAGVMFDIKNISAETIVITEFGPALDAGAWPIEIYLTKAAASWQAVANNPAAWSFAGLRNVTSTGNQEGTALTGFSIALAPGASRGVYLTSTQGAPLRCTGINGGVQRQFDNGTLQVSSAPGASVGYPFGQTSQSRAFNGYVKCATTRTQAQQIAGLPSGADFPIGTTVNTYSCTDQSGNIGTASFSITVQPYNGTTSTLICASMVNASLGPNCQTTLQADDILFGGPYRCFDAYVVQIDKIPPFNDGPWVPGVLNSADIGKTYGVRVTDPVNNNFCLANVLVEDKLPPMMTGPMIELPCNFNTTPTFSAPASVVREFSTTATLPANATDFHSLQLQIPVTAPADAQVEDVDLYIRINGDAFEKNLRIELENPEGEVVVLWNQATGCNSPLWVRFDDEGGTGGDCTQFTTNKPAKIPFGNGLLSAFDGDPVAGNWVLRVRDLNGFGDVSTVTELSLILRYNATFSAGFPNNLAWPGQIMQVSPSSFVVAAPLLDGCSTVTLTYSDETTTQDCATGLSAIINRTWTATDASNNTGTFVQVIKLMRPDFDDVVLPPNFNDVDAPAFGCGSPYPTPAWIEAQGKQGFPHVFGQSNGCSINWSYTDVLVNTCPGAYTINRNWSVVDACSAQSVQTMQQIKVLDRQAPAMTCPADLTVSTDLYNCCATVNLPDVVVEDACSTIAALSAKVVVFNQYSGDTTQIANVGGALGTFPGNNTADPDTLAAFGTTTCLPIGTHHVYYKVEDACGNAKTCSYKLAVRDYTAPVAVGHNLTIVSLNADDPGDCYETDTDNGLFAGVTTVPASIFDQGSYDNCNFIRLTVRRVPPYSACVEGLNKLNGAPPCQDNFPDLKSEYERATGESDSIKFYCCEAGATQTLALRCYQLDALGNLSLGANGAPLFNETLVQVEVQDKLKPGCQPPGDVTVSCENFDPTFAAYGLPDVLDNCCLDAAQKYQNQPGLTHVANYTQFDTLCNRGTLSRTFTVHDCQGQTSQCSQRIVVTHNIDFAIRFPDDVVITGCDSSGIYGEPVFYGEKCELLAVSHHDEILNVVPDACYLIERTWKVINWCAFIPGAGCIQVPNPTPSANLNATQNLQGPVVSPPGTPAPWTATVTKITPTDQQATDYSTYWNTAVNCYEYKQIIKVQDTQDPEIIACPSTPLAFCDSTSNDAGLWNQPDWTDPVHQTNDLNEAPVDLSVTATDLCSGAGISADFLLFLDLDNDGVMETVVNSKNPPVPGKINFDNADAPNFIGGTSLVFDSRAVAQDDKYRWAVHQTVSGNTLTASVDWKTLVQMPTPDLPLGLPGIAPQLPHGKHKIKWNISDGCGNESTCEYTFEIKDCKPPTIVCHNGLSVNIMPSQTVQLWATDFLQYSQDNCTPPTATISGPNQLVFALRPAGSGVGFPTNPDGSPQGGVVFTCAEVGMQAVELWARDKAGNADFCQASVNILDNNNHCDPNNNPDNITVAGALKTDAGDGLEDANVHLIAITPTSSPAIDLNDLSDDAGQYIFADAVPPGSDYTLTPLKDDNPLNGVSTFDLVLISKHILGLEPFDSPYKMIAADANKSNSITTFDIVEIRKLILGIYSEMPNNTSWRFVDKDFVFPQSTNPFTTQFPETKSVADVQSDQLNDDFVAIKVGDVNNTAMANALVVADDRSSGTLLFDVDDRDVQAGELVDVTLTAAEKVQGFQFTLNLGGLEVVDIMESDQVQAGNFGIFDHALTTSINGAQQFTVRFRATQAGKLSQMLSVSGRITRAEAYVSAESPAKAASSDVALRFNRGTSSTVSGLGFELYQNQPNPFDSKTAIGFYLPDAAEATLTILDETGKVWMRQKGNYPKGYNELTVSGKALSGSPGVLYFKLETATNSGVRKMIRVR
jgi:hypothetical protein